MSSELTPRAACAMSSELTPWAADAIHYISKSDISGTEYISRTGCRLAITKIVQRTNIDVFEFPQLHVLNTCIPKWLKSWKPYQHTFGILHIRHKPYETWTIITWSWWSPTQATTRGSTKSISAIPITAGTSYVKSSNGWQHSTNRIIPCIPSIFYTCLGQWDQCEENPSVHFTSAANIFLNIFDCEQ